MTDKQLKDELTNKVAEALIDKGILTRQEAEQIIKNYHRRQDNVLGIQKPPACT